MLQDKALTFRNADTNMWEDLARRGAREFLSEASSGILKNLNGKNPTKDNCDF